MKYFVFLFGAMLFTKDFVYAQSDDTVTYDESYRYNEEETPASSYFNIDPAEISRKKGYDAEEIVVRRFDSEKWKDIVGNKNYLEEHPASKKKGEIDSTSAHDKKRILQRDESDDSQFSISLPIASPILTFIVYAVAIGIIAYLLFLIIQNTSLKSNVKISKPTLPQHSTHVENIKELEIDRLLREAMDSGNYRLVIRIYFLGLLQKLDDDGLIVWKKDKTNRDYLSELISKPKYYDDVKSLTVAYEQVWYGDHIFPERTYQEIISSFKLIDQKIKAPKLVEKE